MDSEFPPSQCSPLHHSQLATRVGDPNRIRFSIPAQVLLFCLVAVQARPPRVEPRKLQDQKSEWKNFSLSEIGDSASEKEKDFRNWTSNVKISWWIILFSFLLFFLVSCLATFNSALAQTLWKLALSRGLAFQNGAFMVKLVPVKTVWPVVNTLGTKLWSLASGSVHLKVRVLGQSCNRTTITGADEPKTIRLVTATWSTWCHASRTRRFGITPDLLLSNTRQTACTFRSTVCCSGSDLATIPWHCTIAHSLPGRTPSLISYWL